MSIEQEAEKLRELVDKAKAGDQTAFAALYDRFLTPLYRFVFFKIGSREEAEDIVQTVFLKAYGALEGFDNSNNTFSAWLYRIARNAVIDFFKKKKSVSMDEDNFSNMQDDDLDDPEEEAIKGNEGDIIKRAMTALSAGEREVIEMKFFQDLSNKEIAGLIGKTEANVRQIQSRAVKQLRIILQDKI